MFTALLFVAVAVADGHVTRDPLLPGSVRGRIFFVRRRRAGDRRRIGIRSVELPAIDLEHNGALLGEDLCNHRDRKHTSTPEKDAVAANRDSFVVRAHELDERPDASSSWFQDRVLAGGREKFPNPPSV